VGSAFAQKERSSRFLPMGLAVFSYLHSTGSRRGDCYMVYNSGW
jgi:hypothetical protein